jgi:small subunit ribosomal protein S9
LSEEFENGADGTDVPSDATLGEDDAAAVPSAEDEATEAVEADGVEPVAAEESGEPEAAEEREEPVAAEESGEPEDAEEREEPVAAEESEEPVAAEESAEPEAVAEAVDEIDEPADGVAAEEATSEDVEEVVVEDASAIAEGDVEEIELTPREKPEIPGADLIPDFVPESEEYLDAEAQAAAEAEAEAAAAAAAAQDQEEAQPIADAAIDLAAGARYTATGKRKTAVARVILKPGTGEYLINSKPLDQFFPRDTLQRMIRQPLETVGYESRMDVIARMHGGGVAAQAGALRHGISRALLEADPHLRGELKRRGFLTRDPRVKERKKAGLKKARKRPQFSKR